MREKNVNDAVVGGGGGCDDAGNGDEGGGGGNSCGNTQQHSGRWRVLAELRWEQQRQVDRGVNK
jgi:hypothetical protein